ncbi:hypothetical protein [Enterobacter asburiae]|uniref:hypothetical protein n=1 Tax=Enterobacter asburiae TaxID=61645 RepID=UPI001CC05EB6|nr:hypothetical protein [Enterobacter asburiae]UAN38021.1 hypothetical protein KGP18_08900 [Enterobacter asburiae]
MTERTPAVNAEFCVSRIFEIVQSMSGQGNTITIPCPYLDLFAGDRQQHLLAAILNQLVFWSGKSHLENGWFYKEHAVLASEVRASSEDVIRKAMSKIITQYLPGVIEEDKRKVNGTPKMHYRINEEALIASIFPSSVDSALKPNGNGSQAESKRLLSRMETAQEPNHGNGSQAESILYTDLKTDKYIQISSCPETSSPDDESPSGDDKKSPAEKPATKTRQGSPEDLQCAEWIFNRIRTLYEKAAETDGEVTRPKEPNWNAWSNDVRLMRTIDGRTHRQICEMFRRVQADPFWCRNVLSPSKLREKWDELVLKLAPAGGVMRESFDDEYYKNDADAAARAGFRV